MPLRAAGVNIAMGLDDKTINDDEDAVMELRMMHKVHRLHTFDLSTPALSAYEALEIATLNGARASGFAGEVGALVPGMKGDAILVDLDRVARDPWIDPEFDIVDAFVERAMGADVDDCRHRGEDHRRGSSAPHNRRRGVSTERCARSVPRASPPSSGRTPTFFAKIKPYVQAWYSTWHETMLDQPFYRVNSRT